ncbi:MAG: response regulator transcription factor [Bacillota bacterium]|nr:response regulator transcription factor [Bacillota bacterium]
MPKRVLIATESMKDSKDLVDILQTHDFDVNFAKNEEATINGIMKEECDLLILDKTLSNIDIIALCERIRDFSDCGIIVIASENQPKMRAKILDAGADDVIFAPADLDEFRARANAILRRRDFDHKNFIENSIIEVEDLKINTLGRVVNVGGKTINLTAKEFDLLILLATNRGEVYSRELLLDKIWGYDEYFADVRTVDVHIRRLRKKIERDPSKPFYVITRWGAGYYFREE